MAHTCPVCGVTCHCNGDIDDICLDLDEDILACNHCQEYEESLEDEFDCCDFEFGCGCCPYDEPICKNIFE